VSQEYITNASFFVRVCDYLSPKTTAKVEDALRTMTGPKKQPNTKITDNYIIRSVFFSQKKN